MTRTIALAATCLSLIAVLSPNAAGAAPADRAEAAFTRAKSEYLALKEDPRRRKYRDQWIAIATKLEGVAKSYPKSRRAPDALYNAAKLYSDLYRVSLNGVEFISFFIK